MLCTRSGTAFSGTCSQILDSPLRIGKQGPRFTSVKQDRYYETLVQVVLCSRPDDMAVPDPAQHSYCCCDPDVDVCRGAAIREEEYLKLLTSSIHTLHI